MVFLRLTVKVRPREQVDQDSRSTVTPNGTTNGADSAAATPGKTIIFQLPVRDPDSITLARLAALIQEKWKLLRPYSPPLDIKKILDAEKPKENLTVDLTVADVFVEHGKAALDGQDQHGTVLVIQKPTAEPVFELEEPVVQDWSAAAATSYNLYKQQSEHLRRPNSNIATIVEEEPSVRSVLNSVEPPEADVQLVPFDDNHGDVEMDALLNGATNKQVQEKNAQMQIEVATKDAVNGGIQSEVAPATQDDGTDEVFVNSVEHQESRESVDSPLSPSSDSSSYDDEDEDGVLFRGREASEELGMSPTPAARSASPRQSVSLNGVHKTNEADEVTPAQPEKTFTPVEPSATEGPPIAVTQTTDRNETPLDRNGNLSQEIQQNNVAKPNAPQASSQITSAVPPSGKKLQLDHPRAPSTPPSNRVDRYEAKSPLSERDRARSVQRRLFSSPPKPLDFPDENRPRGSLGLGVTGSPSADRSRPSYGITDAAKTNKLTLSVNEKTSLHPPAYGTPPQSGGSHIRSSPLRSALRKTSPNHGSEMRRSVSFADDEKPSPASSSITKKNKKKKKAKLPPETSPNPKSQSLSQSSNSPKPMAIAYPPDVPKERIEQYKAEIEMKKKLAAQDTSGGTKRKSPGEHSTEKSKRAKRENSSSLAREQSAVAMSAKSNPSPKPVVHHAHGKANSPAQVTNPKAASDSESESESDEDIDKELFSNASQPAPKSSSVFASLSTAWTPVNILHHDFASIRRARQKEREALGLQAKNPDGSEKSNGKATPAKKDSAGSGVEWNKDIFQITTSEEESSSDDTSDDEHGDILPNGKSRSLQASKLRA